MIIDTHVHYNLSPLVENWQEHWQAAQAAGVSHSLIVGTNPDTSAIAVEQAISDENLFAAVGIHPNDWQHLPSVSSMDMATAINNLEYLLRNHKSKIVAIGETGLDYFRLDKNQPDFVGIKDLQQLSLAQHLALATQYQLPLILHVRDQDISETPTPNNAYWDLVAMVSQHLEHHQLFGLILHCVSGPLSYVKTMVELGAYIGVAGNVTYKSADHIRTLVKATPAKRVLLETDAPFLPPEPHRGKSCEPWMIKETAEALKSIKNISVEMLKSNTQEILHLS